MHFSNGAKWQHHVSRTVDFVNLERFESSYGKHHDFGESLEIFGPNLAVSLDQYFFAGNKMCKD